MRPNPLHPPDRGSIARLALALGIAACGPPTLYDTDLRPVRNPIIVASVGNGRLAVDSTDAGVRAVLELHVEGSDAAAEYLALHVPRLHCSASGAHFPVRVRTEEPRCPARAPAADRCARDAAPGTCAETRVLASPTCLYTVRAEFLFDRVPHLDASHYLTFGQTEAPVVWARSP